jgi:bifunctional non-homologous end joining protein LigD
MLRYPQGIEEEGFYHKDAPDFFPKWIKTLPVEKKEESGTVHYIVANNIATLVYIANYGCITPHLWLSRIDKINYPDHLIFDLDPWDDKHFKLICKKAKSLKKILENFGLNPFVMTTGSRGLHVLVPLKRTKTFDQVRDFAHKIAEIAIKEDPENLTLEIRKEKRGERLFVDIMRNSFGATGVAPYAIRAKPGAPVAAPLHWKEVDNIKSSQQYNISNIFKRITKVGDPWENIDKFAKKIPNNI